MRKRNVYFIMLILAAITLVNWHFTSKDLNALDITLTSLIQTAFANPECGPPPEECPFGYYCDNGICKPYVSLQTQECTITDWCWCQNIISWPYGTDYIEVSCQGVKTVCNPDPYGDTSCPYAIECHGCDPCTDGTPPTPYGNCN